MIISMRSFEKGKVSVITPCYNGGRFLDRYFAALCEQTYDNVELIFINDGSTDNSESVCLSWRSRVEERGYSFVYISQETCRGATSAINRGLPYVTGEFLIWPDCDDTLMPASIGKRVDFLNLHPDYAMVRSDYVEVNEDSPEIINRRGSDWADIKNEDVFENLIFDKTYISPGTYMVRSSVFFERVPRGEIYVNKGKGGQNWPILLACSYRNKCGYIDDPLYTYVIRPDSVSHRIEGDEYSSHKNRTYIRQDILVHVLNDLDLMSEQERSGYLPRIAVLYSLKRLRLALFYNKSADANKEMDTLRNLNVNPGIQRRLLCQLCNAGLSGFYLKGSALIDGFISKIR
jgi:glycosyltransferase involved in cell wall biosynthesis